MLNTLVKIAGHPAYWLTIIFVSIASIAVALYYQHALGEDPCVLCIHVRLWTLAFVAVGILGLLMNSLAYGRLLAHALSVGVAIGFFERSYMTFGVERGFIESSCSISLGLPDWFAVDKWFPSMFEALGMCGQSPVLFSGITMAELLFVGAIGALLLCSACFFAELLRQLKLL